MALDDFITGFTEAQKAGWLEYKIINEEKKRGCFSSYSWNDEHVNEIWKTMLTKKEEDLVVTNMCPFYLKVGSERVGKIFGSVLGKLTSPFNYVNTVQKFVKGFGFGWKYASIETQIMKIAVQRQAYRQQLDSLAQEILTPEEKATAKQGSGFYWTATMIEIIGFILGSHLRKPTFTRLLKSKEKLSWFELDHPGNMPYNYNGRDYGGITYSDTFHSNGLIERDIIVKYLTDESKPRMSGVRTRNSKTGVMELQEPTSLPCEPVEYTRFIVKEYITRDLKYQKVTLISSDCVIIGLGDQSKRFLKWHNYWKLYHNGRVEPIDANMFERKVKELMPSSR
ncbi:MAG: hypothetical protein Q8R37_01920 [Nanoarchaeota archaeon]|nr:hypothetical protein [Nanoarchaeota archaeon]